MSYQSNVRVLHILPIMNRGGAETVVMDIYRNIDRTKVQFDFLVTREDKGAYDDEITDMGGRIFYLPYIFKVGYFRFVKNVEGFFEEHPEYSIVHCHMNEWSGLFLPIAKRYGVNCRVAHSHNTSFNTLGGIRGVVAMALRLAMKSKVHIATTDFFACSFKAGIWLFGKQTAQTRVRVMPNARNVNAFQFNEMYRNEIRKELSIPSEAILVGHAGRLTKQKNHSFLIDIFKEILKLDSRAMLCLVGAGELFDTVKKRFDSEGLSERVIMTGSRSDVNKIMQAFDIFIMPSLFEGLPLVLVEAQAASLPCLVSDTVSNEVDMGMGLVQYESLKNSPNIWAGRALSMLKLPRPVSTKPIYDKGYDIHGLAKRYEEFYLSEA